METERTFYNTNQTTGADLKQAILDVCNQQATILYFFKYNSRAAMTPSQIHKFIYSGTHTPLTSVRRAISNLTKAGKLRKTNLTKPGLYGKNEHCWQYTGKPGQMSLF
jgi:Fe2+ or Zn2+ uptake regulation protein